MKYLLSFLMLISLSAMGQNNKRDSVPGNILILCNHVFVRVEPDTVVQGGWYSDNSLGLICVLCHYRKKQVVRLIDGMWNRSNDSIWFRPLQNRFTPAAKEAAKQTNTQFYLLLTN